MESGSRENGFENHTVVLVVADLKSLPAIALCKLSRGQGDPFPCLGMKVHEAMGSSHGFFSF